MSSPKRILIIKPSSLGDIIHTLPLLYAVRKGFPDSPISWLLKKEWAPLLRLSPYVDEVLDPVFSIGNLSEIIRCARGKAGVLGYDGGFDIAIDAQCLLRSAVLTCFSRKRVGFKSGREASPLFYNVLVETTHMHAVERYMDIARKLECYTDSRDFTLNIPQGVEERVEDILSSHHLAGAKRKKRLIAVNPNARWETKRWPLEKFQQLIGLLTERNFSIIILGGSSEREYSGKLGLGMGGGRSSQENGSQVINLTGELSLPELTGLLREVDLFITNDTGPMHIAAAVNTPVVAIFAATDPEKTGPYTNNAQVVQSSRVCAPCFKKKCPDNMECMAEIKVEEVFDAVSRLHDHQGEIKNRTRR